MHYQTNPPIFGQPYQLRNCHTARHQNSKIDKGCGPSQPLPEPPRCARCQKSTTGDDSSQPQASARRPFDRRVNRIHHQRSPVEHPFRCRVLARCDLVGSSGAISHPWARHIDVGFAHPRSESVARTERWRARPGLARYRDRVDRRHSGLRLAGQHSRQP